LDASQNTVVERLAGLNKQLLEAENGPKDAEAEYQRGGPRRRRARSPNPTVRHHTMKLRDLKQKRASWRYATTKREIKRSISKSRNYRAPDGNAQPATLNAVDNSRPGIGRPWLAKKPAKVFNQQKSETVTR